MKIQGNGIIFNIIKTKNDNFFVKLASNSSYKPKQTSEQWVQSDPLYLGFFTDDKTLKVKDVISFDGMLWVQKTEKEGKVFYNYTIKNITYEKIEKR